MTARGAGLGAVTAEQRVAVVLPVGGARGAYEVGALSALLPALAERGITPRIWTGASVGAINAAFFASTAHLPVDERLRAAAMTWSRVTRRNVVRSVVSPRILVNGARYLGDVLHLPGVALASILDPAPLRRNLPRWVDFDQIAVNLDDGVVDAVCVVATGATSGRSVGFVAGPAGPGAWRFSREITYVPVELTAEHVRASAAIPGIFPPVLITEPDAVAGWYVDGGVRLPSPIKPALDLGADAVIVIGMDAGAGRSMPDAERGREPRLSDVIGNALQGVLVDPVLRDVRQLAEINTLFGAERQAWSGSDRRARGKAPFRTIPYAYVAPAERGAVGRLARRVYEERYGGLWRGLARPDYPLLSRLLGGTPEGRAELLSYLFFDPVYSRELIRTGREDAESWLAAHPEIFVVDATPFTELGPVRARPLVA